MYLDSSFAKRKGNLMGDKDKIAAEKVSQSVYEIIFDPRLFYVEPNNLEKYAGAVARKTDSGITLDCSRAESGWIAMYVNRFVELPDDTVVDAINELFAVIYGSRIHKRRKPKHIPKFKP